jgi:hypothetical protein
MALILMYVFMIFDLMMTVMHYEQAGELNPMFEHILAGRPIEFIYIKLAFNSLAALGILILMKYRPRMGRGFAIFGLVVYFLVAYIHVEVYRVNNNFTTLIPKITSFIDSYFY